MEEFNAELVNLEDWEQSGEGWNAITYYHRNDDSLLLKMNSGSMPYEETLREFKFTKAVHDLGVKCPDTVRFVTDGNRYGFITERLVGKKSFTRILSEQPGMLDSLARDMAAAARELHSCPCDTTLFSSNPERLRSKVNSCKWVKGRVKAVLNAYADGLRPVTTCLHGDMHPGNYLRADKGDYWIDLGRFGYGDPDMDYASQYMLANLAPAPMVKWILHIDSATYSRFVERFGEYYYGEDFHTPETQERLRRAVCVVLGNALTKSRAGLLVYRGYILGHEKRTRFLLKLISPLVRAPEK